MLGRYQRQPSFYFVTVKDCAKANICAMKSNAVDSFYNVGTGKKTSLKSLAELLVQITNCKKPIKYIFLKKFCLKLLLKKR